MTSHAGLEASLLKNRKGSKNQTEIFACALQNSCSEIGKAQENFYALHGVPFEKRYPVILLKQGSTADIFLEMFRLFSAKEFHKNTSKQLMFILLVSKIINALAGQLPMCNRRSTAIDFRILVRSHESLYQNSLEKISDGVIFL